MIIYDSLFPKEFCESMIYEGKYAVESSDGNYYRFTYPPYKFAIDVENYLIGMGLKSQCDIMYFSKRTKGDINTYKQFTNPDYSILVYFINDNYIGGELQYKESTVKPFPNTGVYFDSGIDVDFKPILEGTQYLLISYFRNNLIKYTKSII